MSRNLANSEFYDEGLIDNRNDRPLAVAFAAILFVWAMAFGVASASGQLHAPSAHLADDCARILSTMVR